MFDYEILEGKGAVRFFKNNLSRASYRSFEST